MSELEQIIAAAESSIDVDMQQYFGGYYADMQPEGDA